MSVNEREYMARPDEEAPPDMNLGVLAKDRSTAETILRFACPTQAADGMWYRTTIALTHVPVRELYNILSNANFIAQRMREIAKEVGGESGREIELQAARVDGLREMIKQADSQTTFKGANVHAGKTETKRNRNSQ